AAAQADLDARHLPALLGVVRRLPEHFRDLREILLDGVGMELHARDDFGCRAHRRVVVEEFRTCGTHGEAAGERGWKLLHAEQREGAAHGLAGEMGTRGRAAAVLLLEKIEERHRVDESLPRHIPVAAVARRGPCEAALDHVLAESVRPDAKHRAVLPGVRHEAVREQHEVAVPLLGNLDAIQPAVVFAEERLRARQRLERRVAELPLLLRARHGSDSRLPERLRPRRSDGEENGGCGRESCVRRHKRSLDEVWRHSSRNSWCVIEFRGFWARGAVVSHNSSMSARRYTVVIADRTSGVMRHVTINVRVAVSIVGVVLALPILMGLGAKWSAHLAFDHLPSPQNLLQVENGSYRRATGELTSQIQSPETVINDLGARAQLDPAQARAMARLPAIVKTRAAGGTSVPANSAVAEIAKAALSTPEDTFGVLR